MHRDAGCNYTIRQRVSTSSACFVISVSHCCTKSTGRCIEAVNVPLAPYKDVLVGPLLFVMKTSRTAVVPFPQSNHRAGIKPSLDWPKRPP